MAAIDFNNVVDLYIRVSTSEQAEEGYSVAERRNVSGAIVLPIIIQSMLSTWIPAFPELLWIVLASRK